MKKLIYLFALLLLGLLAGPQTTHAQVKIGNNAKTIGASSNLEVEAAPSGTATVGNKFMVDKATGQVTIQDGTQGAGKVLTSDGNGGSSWQSLATQRIPEVVFIGEQQGNYTVTGFNGTFNVVKDRIPLVPRAGSLAGYDATTKEYTIQQDGYYRIYIGAYITGTQQVTGTFVRLYLQPFGTLQQFNDISPTQGPVLSLFWEAYITAGTKVNPFGIAANTTNGGAGQSVVFARTFMSVTKLF